MTTAGMTVGIALFGIGRAGMIHFRNLLAEPRAEIRYIVEQDADKAQNLIQKYRLSDCKVLDPGEAKQVYGDPRVDAVVVCTPTFTHEEIVLNALRQGRGVFCEKPIGIKVEGTQLCYEEATKAGKPLLCSFNRRFDPTLLALHRRVWAGELGTVQRLKTCSRDSPLPTVEFRRTSGGLFHDCAVHDIDLICWMLQDYPTSVYTSAHAFLRETVEMNDVDIVVIVMTFASGVIATIDLARHALYGYDQRLEVFGSDGMVISSFQQPTGMISYNKLGIHSDPMKHSFPQRYSESYVAVMQHFIDVMLGNVELSVLVEETVKVTKIATACEESHRTGLPVTLQL